MGEGQRGEWVERAKIIDQGITEVANFDTILLVIEIPLHSLDSMLEEKKPP